MEKFIEDFGPKKEKNLLILQTEKSGADEDNMTFKSIENRGGMDEDESMLKSFGDFGKESIIKSDKKSDKKNKN